MARGSCRCRLAGAVVGVLIASAAAAATPNAVPDTAAAAAAAASAAAKRRAERADYQLLYIYPDEQTFRKLWVGELDVVRGQLHQAGLRLGELLAKRRRLNEQAEFYKTKPPPPDLQLQLDESDAALTASKLIFQGLEDDVARIVRKYEHPRERLEKLWAGAPLGSMGLYDPGAPASAASR